jgi:manganese/zinc/iron transport system permease protein
VEVLALDPISLALDPTVGPVAAGTAALGAVTGAVGTFAVVRRQSLQGDAVSHAALPGVALAYLAGGRSEVVLVLGAALSGWVAMALVTGIVRSSRVPFDAALGGSLAVFFGLGLVAMLAVNKHVPGATTFRPQQYLFGQEAALMRVSDLWPVLGLGGAAIAAVGLFWKEFKLLAFDPDFGSSIGLPARRLDLALTGLIVIAVVLGLSTVGVVLMSSLIVAPASAARQWSDRLGRVTLLAGLFGATAGFAGTLLSHLLTWERVADGRTLSVPTGPTIVLVATALTLLSLLVAPRGIVWRLWPRRVAVEGVPA